MKNAEVLAILHTPGNDIVNQTEGKYDNIKNILEYNEKDEEQTLVHFDFINNILTRENDSIELEYQFIENETTKNKVNVKNLDQILFVSIFTKKILIDDRYICIKYQIVDANEECTFEIKYEEI